MAVLELKTFQVLPADEYRKYPIDDHGKFRLQSFNLQPVTVLGDIGTTFLLADLPPGRVRVLPHLSRLSASAWGASRTLAIGHKAYATRGEPNGTTEADNPTAFASALDVSAATNAIAWSNIIWYDIYSLAGVRLYATVAGGTVPAGATLRGYCAYIYE